MRNIVALVLISLFLSCEGPAITPDNAGSTDDSTESSASTTGLKGGDIVFQISKSRQSKAIQLATNSVYSHVGIVFEDSGQLMVYEAVEPVRIMAFEEWIDRGERQHYVAKRLIKSDSLLTPQIVNRMRQEARRHLGKNYDLYFEWSDDRMYCSELVWKVYEKGAGIAIGDLAKLQDFNLSNAEVSKAVRERYGDNIPLDEVVISPAAIFDSPLLREIRRSN